MFKKKTSPRKLPGQRELLSQHRAVTSPVDNRAPTTGFHTVDDRAPTTGFHTASYSEPDLTVLKHDVADGFGESKEFRPINTLALKHVKSDGFSSNEHLEDSSELCELQQFSQSSSFISLSSNHSLHEASTGAQEETDFVLLSQLKKLVKSASDASNDTQNCPSARKNKRDLLGWPRPLSSPNVAIPPPIPQDSQSSGIEDAYTKPSEGVKLLASKSHSDLSPSATHKEIFSPHKESPHKASSFLNLHKSFASAWQIFIPKNKRKSSAQDLPPPPSRKRTTTLAEYCEEQELQLTSSDNDEFCVIPTGSASIQWLAPQRKQSESELEREELMRLATAELEAHTNEHLQWRERKLRSTSMWSTSGVTLPPADPFEIQFECEIKQTLTIALATVVNLREVPNDDTSKQLAEYVLKVFDTDDDTVRQQWRKASTQEKPELKLVCTVRSGSGLIAKDANGKSDPYVRIGIIDATYQGEDIVKKENLLDWKKKGGVMPTGEIVMTSVQKATLNPRWNESLELFMGSAEREMLVVEVWDSDKDMAAPTKVKGIRHFVKDLRKTDDYMGRAFLSLWTLKQVQGKEMELFSHSGKSPYGSIIVDLSVEQVKKNTSLEVGMWEHLQLTHGIVNYEGRVGGQYRRKWRGELSEEAEKLLDKHAEFSGLSEAHKAAIRLSILIKYHRMFAVKMSTFSSLIQRISALAPEIAALEAKGYTEGEVSHYNWIAVLIKDLGELVMDIEEVLKNHLTVLNIKDPKDVDRLSHRVDILLQLYNFTPFVERLPEEKRRLSQLLEKSIQVAVPIWFLVLCANLMPDQNTPDMQLIAFKGLIEHILNHCRRVLQHINPIFQRAGVDYFTHFYLIIDKLIVVEAMSKLEIRESPDAVTTYEMYRAIKEIKKLKKSIPKEHRQQLQMANFHKHFQRNVNQWIDLATERCRSRIKQAIELDTVVQVTEDVQFSSSAVDGTGFLFLLMKLSDELEWPAKAEAFTFKISVVKSVCECALFYVSEVYNRLRPEDMFNQQGNFRATEKLSIVLNNMQHIKTVILKHLMEHSLKQSSKKLTKEEQDIQTHSKEVMGTIIQSTAEDIDTKLASIIRQIISKMSPDITALIEAIVERKTPTTSLEVIDPLMSYLASNLQTLGNHLLTPVFQLILTDMWRMSSDCLQRVLNSDSAKKSGDRSQYYSKLRFILHSVRELFHADGDGLDLECLDTDNYKELQYQLDVLSLQTDKLILRFFSDLADIQTALVNLGEDKNGKILLSVGYHQDKEVIEVNLFQANNLPGLDTSGLSDPFVELTLMPPWHFGHTQSKKQKTSVKKKTVNPVFNEDIIMPASRESLQTRGAVILLSIFDYDRLSSNDLCGVCVLPCEDIPILSPVRSAFDNPNAVERRNLTLPLFKIPESTIALNELSTRASSSDHRATDFLKENKQILADLDIDNPTLQQKLMTKHLKRIKSSATGLLTKARKSIS